MYDLVNKFCKYVHLCMLGKGNPSVTKHYNFKNGRGKLKQKAEKYYSYKYFDSLGFTNFKLKLTY